MLIGGGAGGGVPSGDPGGLLSAAGQLSAIADGVRRSQLQTTGAASSVSGGSWTSPAQQVFTSASKKLSGDFASVAGAADLAAGALRNYAHQLSAAQQAARSALAAQQQAEAEATAAQNRISAQPGPTPGSSHTAVVAHQAAQAKASQSVADQLTSSLNTSSTNLAAAWQTATTAAAICAAGLSHAASVLAPLGRRAPTGPIAKGVGDGGKSWIELFAGWFDNSGHINDFLGGVAVVVAKDYEHTAGAAGAASLKVFESLPTDEAEIQAILSGEVTPAGLDDAGALTESAMKLFSLSDNPISNLLTKGLVPEDAGALGETLGKVPVIGALFAAGDIALNLHDGKSVAYSVGVPTANLAIGTVSTELVTSLLASSAIPVAGEVVIAGAVAVVASIAIDKGVSYVWGHRAAIEHGLATAADQVGDWGVDAVHYGADAYKALASVETTITSHVDSALGSAAGWVGHQVSGVVSGTESLASGAVKDVSSVPGLGWVGGL